MGVTLARQAILGGEAIDQDGSYAVGAPLTENVGVFIGIAGANLGLADCYAAVLVPTCNQIDGSFPGQYIANEVIGTSQFLHNLNQQTGSKLNI